MEAKPNTSLKIAKLNAVHARRICESHGFPEAAKVFANQLLDNKSVGSTKRRKLVDEQLFLFADALVESVERASRMVSRLERLPARTKQGTALRDVESALERLRLVLIRNWSLIEPLVGLEMAENLEKLLSEDAVKQLLPAKLRSEFVEQQAKPSKFSRQGLNLSYLLKAEQQILMRIVKGGKIVLRQARSKISSGAPMKAPFEFALITQLADHYEWALQKKASATVRGPFSQFCEDVFGALGLTSAYEWDRLLKNGLKQHRSNLAVRLLHARSAETQSAENMRRKRKPRKQELASSKKRKIPK